MGSGSGGARAWARGGVLGGACESKVHFRKCEKTIPEKQKKTSIITWKTKASASGAERQPPSRRRPLWGLRRVLWSKHFFFSQCWKIRLVIPLKLVKCHSCVFKLSLRRSRWVCLRLQGGGGGGGGCNLPKVTIINVKLLQQQYVCKKERPR